MRVSAPARRALDQPGGNAGLANRPMQRCELSAALGDRLLLGGGDRKCIGDASRLGTGVTELALETPDLVPSRAQRLGPPAQRELVTLRLHRYAPPLHRVSVTSTLPVRS
jgi:hypothetical protein